MPLASNKFLNFQAWYNRYLRAQNAIKPTNQIELEHIWVVCMFFLGRCSFTSVLRIVLMWGRWSAPVHIGIAMRDLSACPTCLNLWLAKMQFPPFLRALLALLRLFLVDIPPHTTGGTAATATAPFRPGNPALCGSRPLVAPCYCRLGGLLWLSVYPLFVYYFVCVCTLCLKKMHQLWNGIAQNCRDRFWWFLAEMFKSL